MAQSIRYGVAECLEALERIAAEMDEVAQMPTSSGIRGQYIALGRTHGDLERERILWTRRLKIARRFGWL